MNPQNQQPQQTPPLQPPAMQPQAAAPQAAPPPPPPPMQTTPKSKVWLVVTIIVVVLLAVAGGAWWWLSSHNNASNAPVTSTAAIDSLATQKLTADSVNAINKDDAFYVYVKNAAEQSQLVVTKGYFLAAAKPNAQDTTYSKAAFDYKTKKVAYAEESVNANGTRDKTRCVDGKEFMKVAVLGTWKDQGDDAKTFCALSDHLGDAINDGFNTGGLNADQAEKFVAYLRGKQGLMAVKSLALETHAGKQYLHFVVSLTPVQSGSDYLGRQWLMWAFKETGLDPSAWPYGYSGAGGSGMALDYYVDPTTKLPAYSVMTETPLKDSNGTDQPQTDYSRYRVQYQFGTTAFDASTSNDTNLAITW